MQRIQHLWFKTSALALLLVASVWPMAMSLVDAEQVRNWGITETQLSGVFSDPVSRHQFPPQISLPGFAIEAPLSVQYTIDPELQQEVERRLERHNPDYGIYVAIDPDTGHILAMADSRRDGLEGENLSIVNTYPAASISKIITAVAAVDTNRFSGDSIIPFNGKSTSLYKKHVFNHSNNKWTRHYSLNESFAKSVNPVFGRLGAVELGGETMLNYAYRLGFNARFASDFQFNNGFVELDPADDWQIAEMASGYTTRNTLSPLHGAVLAATAVNGGNLVAPVIVESLTGPHGIPIYVHEQPGMTRAMDESSAQQLKVMMQETVRVGSARKSFSKFFRDEYEDVIAGGKTGSLTGFKPKGRYDWFVGFGQRGDRKLAYAMLCINKEKWYVKSSRFAREMLEYYFDQPAT